MSLAPICPTAVPDAVRIFASGLRSGEQWLAYLPCACGQDRSLGLIEVEAGRLPIQPEEFNQPAAFAFQIGDQRLVVNCEHAEKQEAGRDASGSPAAQFPVRAPHSRPDRKTTDSADPIGENNRTDKYHASRAGKR